MRVLQKMLSAVARQVPDAFMLAGAVGVSYGAWLVYEPAGFMVAGALAIAAGVLMARAQ